MVVIARFWSKFQKKNDFFLIFFAKCVILGKNKIKSRYTVDRLMEELAHKNLNKETTESLNEISDFFLVANFKQAITAIAAMLQ
jgi:hypothetical protein